MICFKGFLRVCSIAGFITRKKMLFAVGDLLELKINRDGLIRAERSFLQKNMINLVLLKVICYF